MPYSSDSRNSCPREKSIEGPYHLQGLEHQSVVTVGGDDFARFCTRDRGHLQYGQVTLARELDLCTGAFPLNSFQERLYRFFGELYASSYRSKGLMFLIH